MANLHIVFVKGPSNDELRGGARTLSWTAPSTARKGDIALFYLGETEDRGIWGIGRTAEDAVAGVPDRSWTKSKKGWFADYDRVRLLTRPLHFHEIQAAFPDWERWSNLAGVRVHTVPEDYRGPLARWIARTNPLAKAYLRPWIAEPGKGNEVEIEGDGEIRYEGAVVTRTHTTYERDRRNRAIALAKADPALTCQVCGFDFAAAYGPSAKGFIEVHHAKPVSTGIRKPSPKDLVVLCSNCHSIAHWKQGSKPLSVAELRRRWMKNGARAR
jgi:hypothetical protein